MWLIGRGVSSQFVAVSANSSATVPVHQFFGGVVDGFGNMCLLHERDVSFIQYLVPSFHGTLPTTNNTILGLRNRNFL